MPSFLISTERLKQLKVETLNDKTLQRVASYIAQRWPKLQNQLNPELKLYYNLRDEYIIVIYLILKGSKIVIPSTLNTLIPYTLATKVSRGQNRMPDQQFVAPILMRT